MAVSIGSAQFVMFSKDGVVFDDGKVPLLAIHLIYGRLLVSTQIRDETGSLIAETKDNEWKQGPAIFDRNYTHDVLEIRDYGTTEICNLKCNLAGPKRSRLFSLLEWVDVHGRIDCR